MYKLSLKGLGYFDKCAHLQEYNIKTFRIEKDEAGVGKNI